jgi:hypothetical protein
MMKRMSILEVTGFGYAALYGIPGIGILPGRRTSATTPVARAVTVRCWCLCNRT